MEEKIIMLVEDNPRDVELTRRALKQADITNRVVVAEDGVDALDYLFGNADCEGCPVEDLPVLVLLDLKLPRVDGHGVLQRIRSEEKTKLLPVVFLTSSCEEEDILRGYNLGVNSYIQKPVTFREFADAIKNVGIYWLLLNKIAPYNRKRA